MAAPRVLGARGRRIGGAVVHDEDLDAGRRRPGGEIGRDRPEGGGQPLLLVEGGDDDRQVDASHRLRAGGRGLRPERETFACRHHDGRAS